MFPSQRHVRYVSNESLWCRESSVSALRSNPLLSNHQRLIGLGAKNQTAAEYRLVNYMHNLEVQLCCIMFSVSVQHVHSQLFQTQAAGHFAKVPNMGDSLSPVFSSSISHKMRTQACFCRWSSPNAALCSILSLSHVNTFLCSSPALRSAVTSCLFYLLAQRWGITILIQFSPLLGCLHPRLSPFFN